MGVKEQYRDHVMTGPVKRVEPVVADRGALLHDADGAGNIDCFAGIGAPRRPRTERSATASARCRLCPAQGQIGGGRRG